jgi:CRP-like cAMP-binding protein
MQSSNTYGTANGLLASLPRASRQRVVADCDVMNLDFSQVLSTAGKHVDHVYFPMSGFVSLVTSLDEGVQLEVALVGNEGMLGAELALGVEISMQDLVVQGDGSAWRMKAADFRRAIETDRVLQRTLNRYVYVLWAQLGQTVACSHFHNVESRLARWLLLTRDRAHSSSLSLTHEYLARMLGVRRAGITQAASSLRHRGLIRYSRGHIDVLDAARLKKVSCGCYRRANQTYDEVFAAG